MIALGALAALAFTGFYILSNGIESFINYCSRPDTTTYYFAARAFLNGVSPYDAPALIKDAGDFVNRWVYPPTAMPFFLPLAWLTENQALNALSLAKLPALIGLAVVWGKLLPQYRRDPSFWLFAAAALNLAILEDNCAGNVATLDSLAVWSCVLLLTRRRFVWALVPILLVGLLKPTLLVLLVLFPMMAPRERLPWRLALGSLIAAGALLLLWFALDRVAVFQWLTNTKVTLPMRYNMFELAKDLRLRLGGEEGLPLWQRLEYAIYVLWGMTVVWLTWRRWRAGLQGVPLAALVVLAFAAVNPANLSYSWLVPLPAVYVAMFQTTSPLRLTIALLALVPPALTIEFLPPHILAMIPLLAIMLAFLAFALQAPRRDSRADHDHREPYGGFI